MVDLIQWRSDPNDLIQLHDDEAASMEFERDLIYADIVDDFGREMAWNSLMKMYCLSQH